MSDSLLHAEHCQAHPAPSAKCFGHYFCIKMYVLRIAFREDASYAPHCTVGCVTCGPPKFATFGAALQHVSASRNVMTKIETI